VLLRCRADHVHRACAHQLLHAAHAHVHNDPMLCRRCWMSAAVQVTSTVAVPTNFYIQRMHRVCCYGSTVLRVAPVLLPCRSRPACMCAPASALGTAS
jgi:hypothetical protein